MKTMNQLQVVNMQENDYIDNYWTYSLDDIWAGLQGSYKDMKNDVKEKYGVTLTTIGSIG